MNRIREGTAYAESVRGPSAREVFGGDGVLSQRSAKGLERCKDLRRIRGGGPHEDVHVVRCANMTVQNHGPPPTSKNSAFASHSSIKRSVKSWGSLVMLLTGDEGVAWPSRAGDRAVAATQRLVMVDETHGSGKPLLGRAVRVGRRLWLPRRDDFERHAVPSRGGSRLAGFRVADHGKRVSR